MADGKAKHQFKEPNDILAESRQQVGTAMKKALQNYC